MKKVILVAVLIVMLFCLTGCTEGWKRTVKSYESNWGGGLNRTVSVYSYDGDMIKSWSGKFDVSDSTEEVYFDINGKRVIIQGGIIINEEN